MTKTKLTRGSTKNKWGIPLLVAIVIGLAGAGYYTYMSSQAQNNDGGSVDTATIGTGDIILTATGIGTLIPSEEVAFGFNNDGKISEVYVSLGDHVEAGQVLARLESTTLELKYKQAESNLAALTSPAEIAKAEQTVQDAKLSFATARNDLQYLIGPDMLYTEEKVAEAQERLDLAKAEAEKDASDANKQNVLDAESALAKARGALNYVYYAYSSDYTVNTFTYPIRNDNGITVRKELIAPTDAEVSAARAAYELAKANLKDAQNYLDVLKGKRNL